MVVENYLLLIVSGLALGVIFFYFLCETLIRLERRKAESRKSGRYKSFEDGKQGEGIHLRKASAPPATAAAAAGGYMLLPLSRSKQNVNSNEKPDDQDREHKAPEDPRSPEAWQRQDSGNSFAERKEDPWICKNGAVALGTPVGPGKPIVEEVAVQQGPTPGTGPGLTETAALVTTAAVIGGNEAGVNEVTKPAFSTAGFWEAREAAKVESHGGGGGGYDYTGGGYNSSSGGYDSGGGSGSLAYAWGAGNDGLTGGEKAPGWGQSSESEI